MSNFEGFDLDQQHSLLSKMGYKGPKNGTKMDEFMAASPEIAARMGKLATAATKYKSQVKAFNEGGDMGTQGYDANGNLIDNVAAGQMASNKLPGSTSPFPDFPVGSSSADPNSTTMGMGQIWNDDAKKSFSDAYKSFLGRDPSDEALANAEKSYNIGTSLEDMTKTISTSDEAVAFRNQNNPDLNLDQATASVDSLKGAIAAQNTKLQAMIKQQNENPDDPNIKAAVEQEQARLETMQGDLTLAQENQKNLTPTGKDLMNKAVSDPTSLITKAVASGVNVTGDQFIAEGTGTVGNVQREETSTAGDASTAAGPETMEAAKYDSNPIYGEAQTLVDAIDPVTGEVTKEIDPASLSPELMSQLGLSAAQIEKAATVGSIGELELTPNQLAKAATLADVPKAEAAQTNFDEKVEAAKFETETPQATASTDYALDPTNSATLNNSPVLGSANLDPSKFPAGSAALSNATSVVNAALGTVSEESKVDTSLISIDPNIVAGAVEATAATMDTLNAQAVAVAAQGNFNQNALATAAQGTVPAQHTVQGQLGQLMQQFNDGTPAWAAGGIRAANAAMAARGLGGSSMAGAAILQAAMESALPIASQDAQLFETMRMANLSNRQQVALSNAAAQQNITLANLSNRQQAALQNSSNAFALQGQSLSNQQQVVLANQAVKQAMAEKSLDINTAAVMANAGLYAEMNNINLTNSQQAIIAEAGNKLQIDMANLSNSQQMALSNLQVQASLTGQNLTNEQQMAVLQSTQNYGAAEFNATSQQQAFMQDAISKAAMEGKVLDNKQQTALFNVSSVLSERGIELEAAQQTKIFNTSNALQVDLANMSNRQQTALANAQIDAAIKGQELTNKQQVNILNAERIAEIANVNFSSKERIALANAEIMNSVDVANLNAANAKVLSDSVALTQVDMTNLNNRQQAQVQNANNFLQMDLTNATAMQQTSIFKNQTMFNAMLSDQAADNAAKQFNAASDNQIDTFFADLSANINKFNSEQINLVNTFNAGEENGMKRFYGELDSLHERFNATNALAIAQANTKWRQDVALTDSAYQQEANMLDAKNANGLTSQALDAIWQMERDIMAYAFQYAENAADRDFQIFMADKEIGASKDAANKEALGYIAGKILFGSGGSDGGGLLSSFL